MNLIAILLALGAERFATQVLHLRELRWFDYYFDFGLRWLRGQPKWVIMAGAIAAVVLAALPVWLIAWALRDVLLGGLYLLFATIVLFLSLGPRDLLTETEKLTQALEEGNLDDAEHRVHGILETSDSLREVDPPRLIRGILVQSKNQIFGVLFWFALLGPAGAFAYRASDLLRRRGAFKSDRNSDDENIAMISEAFRRVHGVLAWPPSRVLAVGFALAGSFEGAIHDWRGYYHTCSQQFFEINDDIIACSGRGALGNGAGEFSNDNDAKADAVLRARGLVWRTLIIWIVLIAILVIYGGLQ